MGEKGLSLQGKARYDDMNKDDDYSFDVNRDGFMASEPKMWGGRWTEEKLCAFEKYVHAYLTIMNNNRDKFGWKLLYFDGFAGSGSRGGEGSQEKSPLMEDLFDAHYISQEELDTYKGSAERVLNIDLRGFDYYYFIDKDKKATARLDALLSPYKESHVIECRADDANNQLRLLSDGLRRNKKLKSLVLLDPFGMQVEWSSIEMLKGSSTDLFILIPSGVIINRLLYRNGASPHYGKLSSFFGLSEAEIKERFYEHRTTQTLFGDTEIVEKVKNPIQKIYDLYRERLGTIFRYVTEDPLVLYNNHNLPIFHFACASNNETAVKIAGEIIKNQQQ